MVLRFIYTIFIGILLSLFIGLGISTFYEKPKEPTPVDYRYTKPLLPQEMDSSYSAKMEQGQIEQNKRWEAYSKQMETYTRNVSIISLAAAIIVLIISLALFQNLLLISDGLLLGGVFTLLYSVFRSFETKDSKFQFIVVTIGLIIALVLGYKKFIQPSAKTIKKH